MNQNKYGPRKFSVKMAYSVSTKSNELMICQQILFNLATVFANLKKVGGCRQIL